MRWTSRSCAVVVVLAPVVENSEVDWWSEPGGHTGALRPFTLLARVMQSMCQLCHARVINERRCINGGWLLSNWFPFPLRQFDDISLQTVVNSLFTGDSNKNLRNFITQEGKTFIPRLLAIIYFTLLSSFGTGSSSWLLAHIQGNTNFHSLVSFFSQKACEFFHSRWQHDTDPHTIGLHSSGLPFELWPTSLFKDSSSQARLVQARLSDTFPIFHCSRRIQTFFSSLRWFV